MSADHGEPLRFTDPIRPSPGAAARSGQIRQPALDPTSSAPPRDINVTFENDI
jgi:hypothetical protein